MAYSWQLCQSAFGRPSVRKIFLWNNYIIGYSVQVWDREMENEHQSFDPIEYVDAVYPDLPMMGAARARKFEQLIVDYDLKDTLELGFYKGKSSAYIGSILKSLGRGHHTAIDMHYAEPHEPNIEEVMTKLELTDYVTWYYEQQSYLWRLMRFLEKPEDNLFDFCYLDGGHVWDITGFGFMLVDRLLRPGGVIVFDDLDWTIEVGIPEARWPKYPDIDFRDRFMRTKQVKKVFELLAMSDQNYECEIWNDDWGIARKKENS